MASKGGVEEMRMSGMVEGGEVVDGEGRVELKIRGANQLGDHVRGTVHLVLATDGSES